MMKRAISVLLSTLILLSGFTYSAAAARNASVEAEMGQYSGSLTGATWYWPLHGFDSADLAFEQISSAYGYRGGSYCAYHKGVDIAADKGTAVYAVRGGTVYLADYSPDGSQGRSVIVDHGDGYYSAYYHLSSLSVSQGQAVDMNTKLGAVGGSGYNRENAYADHLHLAIHYGDEWNYHCSVNPCPVGSNYANRGDSLQARNGGFAIGEASISYVVPDTATALPEKPALRLSDSIYYGAGSAVTIQWDPVDAAVSYNYYIAEYPAGYAYSDNVKSGNTSDTAISFSDLPSGAYTVFVQGVNSLGEAGAQSDWQQFTVHRQDYVPVKTASYDGHTYILYDDELAWTFARDLCRNMGGHLATVTSAEESDVISQLTQSGGKDRYWLGASNEDLSDYQDNSKAYEWVTGEPFEYARWAQGGPDGGGTLGKSEHFLRLVKSDGAQWDDAYNTDRANTGFILELEPEASAAADADAARFSLVHSYYNGLFRDVAQGNWFGSNVAAAYELGLMNGTGSGTFSPGSKVTLAEAITLAARIHSIYHTGTENFPASDGGSWYDPYVDYALEHGIIDAAGGYAGLVTREEFVHILARSLPQEALENIAGQITFADESDIADLSAVRLLCGAGVINGILEDGKLYFKPANVMTRAEVAAVVGRMVQPESRLGK